MFNSASFWKPADCSQTALPVSISIQQNLVETDKLEKLECNILGDNKRSLSTVFEKSIIKLDKIEGLHFKSWTKVSVICLLMEWALFS